MKTRTHLVSCVLSSVLFVGCSDRTTTSDGTGDTSGTGPGDDGGNDDGDGTSDGGGSSDGGTGSTDGSGTTGSSGGSSTTDTQSTNTTAPPCEPIRLADIAAGIGGFMVHGEDRSARAAGMAGDVNGDGLADVIVGAYEVSPNGSQSGRSHVVFGKAYTDAVAAADLAQGIGGFVMDGEAEGNRSGFSVNGAGDVNGDGLADVIVGAPRVFVGGDTYVGRSYVVFGKTDTGPVSLADVTQGTGGFVMDGEKDHDKSGYWVSGAGDVNGDGLADVLVGAAGYSGSNSRRAYVVFGKADTDPVLLGDVALGTGGFAVQSSIHPTAVGGAGDVNGDGLADVLVGEHTAEPNDVYFAGRSSVVFGKADTAMVSLEDVAQGAGGFAINGTEDGENSGYSVSGPGDVNGDGLADVIVGAPHAQPNGEGSGRAYVVFGKAGTDEVSLGDVMQGTGGFSMDGLSDWDYLGFASSGAGELNDDGLADILVGTVWHTQVYLVFGKADTEQVSLADVAQGIGGFAIETENAEENAGCFSLGGRDDVNGDGIPDLVVGTFDDDRTYVVFGGDFSCGGE